MKFSRVSLFASMISTFTHGLSFSELSTGLTVDEENRIYGGSDANINKHRYIASLHNNGTDSGVFCGGTLITPDFILTAGHCLEWLLYDVYASLGSKDKMGDHSRKSEMIRVVEAFRHPSYKIFTKSLTVTHDVALLKLETPSKIKPVRLAAADGSDNKSGTMATTLGWGLVNNETFSDILQTVDVEIITNTKCSKQYADADEKSIVDDSVICAGTGNGKDACNGDSGGPLLVNDVLVGVVSAGPDVCGVLPGTYARVSYALDFINDIIDGKSIGDVTKLLTAGTSILFEATPSQGGSYDDNASQEGK